MKDCFDPRSYGAVADGHSKDTAAVQAAIDAAAAQGGTVRLAGGTFVCGTLYLKSNVALEITNSATLLASPDIADYGTDTHHNRYRNEPELDRCFLFAQDAENVTICGSGVIDGNAAAFPNAGSIYRPMLLRVLRCRNVRVQNLRLLNAAAWATAFLDSDFIWATDLHIENHRNYNGDGLDFDSCRHVWVRGCYIDGTDDNLCLQSSGLPVQDVHISDCAFTSVCVGIRIGLKSIGEISGVVISNCTMRNIWREGIKLECTEGGSITDILVENVTMHNVRRPIFAILNNRYRPDDLGSSIELDHIPPIGTMARLRFVGILSVNSVSGLLPFRGDLSVVLFQFFSNYYLAHLFYNLAVSPFFGMLLGFHRQSLCIFTICFFHQMLAVDKNAEYRLALFSLVQYNDNILQNRKCDPNEPY